MPSHLDINWIYSYPPFLLIMSTHQQSKKQKTKQTINQQTCIDCNHSLDINNPNATSFQLPCPHQHFLCPHCFSKIMAARGCNNYFLYPCNANIKLDSWDIRYPSHSSSTRLSSLRKKKILTK